MFVSKYGLVICTVIILSACGGGSIEVTNEPPSVNDDPSEFNQTPTPLPTSSASPNPTSPIATLEPEPILEPDPILEPEPIVSETGDPKPVTTPTPDFEASSAPKPTSDPTSSPTSGPAPTTTPEPVPGDTITPNPEPSTLPTATPSAEPTASPAPNTSPTPMASAAPTPSPTPSPTDSPTATPTPSSTPTTTPSATPSPTPSASPSPSPTSTPEPIIDSSLFIEVLDEFELIIQINDIEFSLNDTHPLAIVFDIGTQISLSFVDIGDALACAFSQDSLTIDENDTTVSISCQPKLAMEDALAQISDVNFRACLSETIEESFAEDVQAIICPDRGIEDIQGIHLFPNINILRLIDNDISEVDLSGNTFLADLRLTDNLLEKIELKDLTNLKVLKLTGNKLISIDLSKQSLLEELFIALNNLTNISVSNSPNLRKLVFYENGIESINLIANTQLLLLDGSDNNLRNQVDLSNNALLEQVFLSSNSIDSIQFSTQSQIKILDLNFNLALQSIDLTNLSEVENINLQLTQLSGDLSIEDNPKLEILNLSKNSLQSLTAGSNINTLRILNISENSLNTALPRFPNLEELTLNEGGLFTTFDLSLYPLLKVAKLNDIGLESFPVLNNPQLRILHVANNTIEEASASELTRVPDLIELDFSSNLASLIELDNVPGLKALYIHDNMFENGGLNLTPIESLTTFCASSLPEDLAVFTEITELLIRDLQATEELHLSGFPLLEKLGIFGAPDLNVINLEMNPELTELAINDTALSGINLSSNVKLQELEFERNDLATLELDALTDLRSLRIQGEADIEDLTLTSNDRLVNLFVNGTSIETLDLLSNNRLLTINLSFNRLVSLQIAEDIQAISIDLHGNDLTELNFSGADQLETLIAPENNLLSITLPQRSSLKVLRVSDNTGLGGLDLRGHNELELVGASNINMVDVPLGLGEVIDTNAGFFISNNPFSEEALSQLEALELIYRNLNY